MLLAYLKDYRASVKNGTVPTRVLVADRLIPKGTSGDVVATDRLFRPTSVVEDEVRDKALPDATALAGKVAARDIYPGEQLVAGDFAAKADPLRGRLEGKDRALAVSVDQAHGLVGSVRPGDKVDVLASFTGGGTAAGRGLLRTVAQDVLVLKAPSESGSDAAKSGDTSAVVLRLDDQEAARVAYAADNGKVWFALRPPVGARSSKPTTVTQQTLANRAVEVTATREGDRVTIRARETTR
jgi:pilus assembly protein CpaB